MLIPIELNHDYEAKNHVLWFEIVEKINVAIISNHYFSAKGINYLNLTQTQKKNFDEKRICQDINNDIQRVIKSDFRVSSIQSIDYYIRTYGKYLQRKKIKTIIPNSIFYKQKSSIQSKYIEKEMEFFLFECSIYSIIGEKLHASTHARYIFDRMIGSQQPKKGSLQEKIYGKRRRLERYIKQMNAGQSFHIESKRIGPTQKCYVITNLVQLRKQNPKIENEELPPF